MHKLLARQLQKCFASVSAVPAPLLPFVSLVDATYAEADDDRRFTEHSMDTVSKELSERHHLAQEAVAMLEAIIESTADGVLVVDRNGRIIRMNHKFAEQWRIPVQVLATRDDRTALAFVLEQLEAPQEFLRKVEELYSNPEVGSFDTLRFKDQRVFERYSTPLRVGGVTTGRVWSFRDVTARLELEGRLRQSQKMEAIGLLAGGVAHDFNNLLTVISGHLEFLAADETVTAGHEDDLNEMRLATSRAVGVTRQLLTFGRQRIVRPVVVDLNVVISELRPMLIRLIGEDMPIDFTPAPSEPLLLADRSQIEQILVNLVVNARDAMPDGGTVVLTVANTRLVDEGRTRERGGTVGQHVLLSVRDSGHGIAVDDIGRIFEPFYTTKELGKGTGLGLATVYGIVRQSGGFIEVHSVVGSGTTFEVFLPAAAGTLPVEAPEPSSTGPIDVPSPKGQTILIIEDEEAVAKILRRTLEKHGYLILEARTGRGALEMVLRHDGPIDLVVSDVVMPEMGGPQFAQHLHIARPKVPVLFVSGYSGEVVERHGVMETGAALLEKPFTTDELLRAVRGAMAHGSLHAATGAGSASKRAS